MRHVAATCRGTGLPGHAGDQRYRDACQFSLAGCARWQNAATEPVNPPWLERAVRTARAKVPGLPTGFRYHDLRHYLASLLIADGADVKTVQARMRHASAKTTLDTYGHLWPDRDESTRATIEAVFVTRRTEQGLNQQGAG